MKRPLKFGGVFADEWVYADRFKSSFSILSRRPCDGL